MADTFRSVPSSKGRKRLRQTLLGFPLPARPHPASDNPSHAPDSVTGSTTRSQAHALPAEIWHRILEPLSPLALKTMRLVCRDWSSIGAPYLFSTFYLNSYEKSWAGLRSLCNSSYAPFVRRIVWNPLVLFEEFLDGPLWRFRYQNIIKGMSQSEISALHLEYTKVFSKKRSLLRSSTIDSVWEPLRNLRNCYECVISDDYDLESACLDPLVRGRVQELLWELPGHATWGLRPKWSLGDNHVSEFELPMDEHDEDEHILHTGLEVFELLQHCRFIRRLSVECWDENWLRMTEHGRYSRKGSAAMHGYNIHGAPLSAIQNISFRLKHCKAAWLPGQHLPSCVLERTFAGMFSFPELRELSLEPVFTDPGKDFIEATIDPDFWADVYATAGDEQSPQSDPDEDDSSDGSTSFPPFSTLSELEDEYRRPWWLTQDMLHSLNAQLNLGLVKLPKLEKLVLTNVTLDARCLLLWLCEQRQLPVSRLSICLQGTTSLFDLDPQTLFQGLAQLNVNLCYDSERTFHYPIPPNAGIGSYDQIGNTVHCIPTTWSVNSVQWSKYELEDFIWEGPPVQMPAFSDFKNVPVGSIEIRRRPSEFASIRQEEFEVQSPIVEAFEYIMPGADGGICDWEADTLVQPEAVALLTYRPH